ncbi:hypothetical protein BN1708_018020, partial [Verticillium longisporum]
AKVSR